MPEIERKNWIGKKPSGFGKPSPPKERIPIAVMDGQVVTPKYTVDGKHYYHDLKPSKARQDAPTVPEASKCEGVKYKSRSHALEHLLHGVEPDELRLDRLEQELEQLKAELRGRAPGG